MANRKPRRRFLFADRSPKPCIRQLSDDPSLFAACRYETNPGMARDQFSSPECEKIRNWIVALCRSIAEEDGMDCLNHGTMRHWLA
jgi:hypothetical protein